MRIWRWNKSVEVIEHRRVRGKVGKVPVKGALAARLPSLDICHGDPYFTDRARDKRFHVAEIREDQLSRIVDRRDTAGFKPHGCAEHHGQCADVNRLAVALLFANCVRCPKICFFIVTIEMD